MRLDHRFERFSLAIFEISRCWHKLAADEMAKYGLKGPHAMYLVTIRRFPEVKDNPLGIYITAFDMKPIDTKALNQK